MRILMILLVYFTVVFPFSLLAEAAVVKVGSANVRSGPGTEHAVVFTYRKNSPLKVIEKSGSWLKVQDFEKDVGWVHKDIVDSSARGAIIKVSNANVRKEPNGDSEVVFVAGYGVAFRIISTKGGWYEVKHEDGDSGWISDDLVFAP